jgi:hypothetical protein
MERSYRAKCTLVALCLFVAGSASSLNAQAASAGAVARYDLRLSEADGRLLVNEELSKGNSGVVRLALQNEGRAFKIENGRVILAATAESGGFVCPVWISGVPVIAANKLSLAGTDVTTDGMMCNGTLTVLKPKALESLTAHPWDLADRLVRASVDPALPGPRLPAHGCLTRDQLTLRDLHSQGNDLIVAVAVAPRGAGRSCP